MRAYNKSSEIYKEHGLLEILNWLVKNKLNANLSKANLRYANLSDAKNLLNPKNWLDKNFEKTKEGYIVFKAIGNTSYSVSKNWKIEKDSFLEEVVNFVRTNDCGCGVNFGTKEFLKDNYLKAGSWWKCLLYFEDLPLLCVPYNTNGKARCGRLQLLEKIKKG